MDVLTSNAGGRIMNKCLKLVASTVVLVGVMSLSVPAMAEMPGGGHMMNDQQREAMMQQRYGDNWRERMGQGMGPGMMGYGPGMGHGMGPGMGYGHGMMGYGPGMGMMGGMSSCMGMGGPTMALDLTDKQRDQIRDLYRAQRKAHWGIMEQMMDKHDKMADLYDADTLDSKAIGKVYDELSQLKRQVIESCAENSNKVRALLNDDQRKQYRSLRRHMGPMGMGMMHY
jgi:Spy/CpxP family protein refolding chaperone